MVGTYVIAVEATRKSADLREIAEVWRVMGLLCDKALRVVSGFKDLYPSSGTPELYDRLLDYKNACSVRFDRVNEELLCKTMPTPQGLFPSKI